MNKMFKLAGLLLLAAPGLTLAQDNCCSSSSSSRCNGVQTDYTSQTFFFIRPQFQSQDPEKVSFFRADRMLMDCDGWGGAFQLAFFGGETRKPKDLARFFFPFGKTELLVQEGLENNTPPLNTNFDAARDIDPQHFFIETVDGNFQSRISICPEQSVFGIGFDWKQMLTCKDNGKMGFWGEISFPVTRVRNKVNLRERVINNGGGPQVEGEPANMIEAFRQERFRFGRIDDRNQDCHEKWGVADVEIKLGYNFRETDCSHVHAWVGIVAPTGDRPNGRNVFEPIIGHNDHFGVMIGGTYGYECWETECGLWRVEADLVSKYFVSGCEVRSFDVQDKQWSRYMQVFANAEDAANQVVSAGINVFTSQMDVSQRFTMNYNTALIYEHNGGFSAEVGYNFYARQQEKICLRNYGFQPQFVDAAVVNEINPARTINHNFELEFPISATTEYVPIRVDQLNLRSAAHPATLQQAFYGGLNYDWDFCQFPTWTNIGASYEFSANNAGITRWTVWGKLGFAF